MKVRRLMALALLVLTAAVGHAQQAIYPVPPDISGRVRAMIELIRSTEPNARHNGLEILILMKEQAAPAAPYIAELLGDRARPRINLEDSRMPPIGSTAAFALGVIGKPAVPAAVAILKNGKPEARRGALDALSRIDDESVATPLAAALLDDNPEVQKAVRFAVGGGIRKRAILPIQPFLEAFDKGNALARHEALLIIGSLQQERQPDQGAVEVVFRGLNDPDPDVRETALRVPTAGGRWIRDNRAVEPLLRALGHKDDRIRSGAAGSVGQYKDRRAVPLLIALLKDSDSSVRQNAAWSLGEIGDVAVVEILCARLKEEPVDYVRDAVAYALGRIGDPKALEALFQTIRGADGFSRQANKTAIEKITGQYFDRHPLWQKVLDEQKRGG